MEEVHKAISRHSQNQNEDVQRFIMLDNRREQEIEKAVLQCENGAPFSVEEINLITIELNKLAGKVNLSLRKTVSPQMVREFVERKNESAKFPHSGRQ
ncbi:DUF2533 family protein [Bacillus mangrovi]|uniref:DUF2533 family protein n=1 Tax=Metabacillus mangrovi TaxID=1491830 RepID=A0A7X2S2Q7_9BACI|nr:DUF2533 family protein [Metabacillus mangrovi]MTH52103.1 DUF2533 family protein [Metabacillus mangrovi]